MKRVLLVVIDSVGVGELPDAALYGDEGCNTMASIIKAVPEINIPNLIGCGLEHILYPEKDLRPCYIPGAYGKMAEKSKGKDTTTGHWEMAGIITDKPMPTFPDGFPDEFIEKFEKRIKRKILGNKRASGTLIIEELGSIHMNTGYPIVYTSADSVFQIAAHEEIIPLAELYRICQIAREMLEGPMAVGRVIARPFTGKPGSFKRTSNRHDYSLKPPQKTILDKMKEAGHEVIGIGKINDIFSGEGLTKSIPSISNAEGYEKTIEVWESLSVGMVFVNLVDFDSLYGHRNDIKGYAQALEEFDKYLPEFIRRIKGENDYLIITADHGNDPSTPSTDHSREFVPLFVFNPLISPGTVLGTRDTFADIAATIADIFEIGYEFPGKSFLDELKRGLKNESGRFDCKKTRRKGIESG